MVVGTVGATALVGAGVATTMWGDIGTSGVALVVTTVACAVAVRAQQAVRAACAAALWIAVVATVVGGAAAGVGWGLAVVFAVSEAATAARWMETRRRGLADLDSVLLARKVDEDGVATVRTLLDLLGGTRGRVLWVEHRGDVGMTGAGDDRLDALAAAALDSGRLARRRRSVAVPLAGTHGTPAVVVVTGVTRRIDAHVRRVVETVARWAGDDLHELRARHALRADGLVDPVTGLGNSSAGLAALGMAADGDAVLLIGLADPEGVLRDEGNDRRELVVCQLGLHLRTRVRSDDMVARMDAGTYLVVVRNPVITPEELTSRLVGSWSSAEGAHRVVAASVERSASTAPVDELDAVRGALRTVRRAPVRRSPFAPVIDLVGVDA